MPHALPSVDRFGGRRSASSSPRPFRSPQGRTDRNRTNSYVVTELVTGPATRPRPRERLGPDPLPDLALVGRQQRHQHLSTLYHADGSKSRPRPASMPASPSPRAPRPARLQRRRRRLPWRPLPVRRRVAEHLRLARRLRADRHCRGRQRRQRRRRRLQGPRDRTADVGDGAQQYLYATDFHNGRIDVFDRTFATQTWDRRVQRPEAPQGLRPVRDPDPQRHGVRDLRQDADGQR